LTIAIVTTMLASADLPRIGLLPTPLAQAVNMSATIDASISDGPSADDVSLDGRVLWTVAAADSGGVGPGTRFDYTQDGDLVSARYGGGPVRLGFCVGTRTGNHLELRYAHVTHGGERATGRADARLELLADGRVRLHEIWAHHSGWDEGARVVEEGPTPPGS
jgi:hypothetical protein